MGTDIFLVCFIKHLFYVRITSREDLQTDASFREFILTHAGLGKWLTIQMSLTSDPLTVCYQWSRSQTFLLRGVGGYRKFISQGLNDHYLPVWLQAAGYNTYYTGKLFNAHATDNYDKPYAAGWTGSVRSTYLC